MFEHNAQIMSSLYILHQHPHSVGNLWFVVLNLHREDKSLSFKILKNFDIPEFAWKFCTLDFFGEPSSVDSQNCRNSSWSLTCIILCMYNLSLSNNINFDWIQFTKGVFVDIPMNGRHKRLYLIYG
jgi:hypothetical protein